MDFTVGSTKLRLPLPLPFSVLAKAQHFLVEVCLETKSVPDAAVFFFFGDCRQMGGGEF